MDEEFEHFCHEHPLILAPKLQIRKVWKKEINCYACHKPISEPAYCCSIDCSNSKFILHKRCLELPRLIEHRLLPGRLLTLTVYEPGDDPINFHSCHNCGRKFEGLAYHGSLSKDFEFDISLSCGCFDYMLEEQRTIQHPSHHHPLTYVRKPFSKFPCDGCGALDWDLAYVCNFCEFWIHKSCASLPNTLESVWHHQHPLSLSYFLPRVYLRFKFNCEICRHRIYPPYWVYSCARCRFLAHVKCVTKQMNSIAGPSNSNIEQEDNSVIQFPVNNVSMDIIVPFLIRQKVLPDIHDALSTIIPTATQAHSFNYDHHPHPLTLVILSNKDAVVDDRQKNIIDDAEEMMVCDACITPINKSCPPHMYYSCDKCQFLLHFSCYYLPPRFEHDHGKGLHKVSLSVKGALSRSSCYICFDPTNGLFYDCEDCSFPVDVKCATMPSVIKHAANRQLKLMLSYINKDEIFDCDACGYQISNFNPYAYLAENYEFNLHYKCAMLPPIVRHRLDKHPIPLAYPPYSHHTGDIYCEICEQEIHPKSWTYHCRECDHFFDPYCLTRCGYYRNLKFGYQLVLENRHRSDHPLTFGLVTLRNKCNFCPREIYGKNGFECASCYLACCMLCAGIDVFK